MRPLNILVSIAALLSLIGTLQVTSAAPVLTLGGAAPDGTFSQGSIVTFTMSTSFPEHIFALVQQGQGISGSTVARLPASGDYFVNTSYTDYYIVPPNAQAWYTMNLYDSQSLAFVGGSQFYVNAPALWAVYVNQTYITSPNATVIIRVSGPSDPNVSATAVLRIQSTEGNRSYTATNGYNTILSISQNVAFYVVNLGNQTTTWQTVVITNGIAVLPPPAPNPTQQALDAINDKLNQLTGVINEQGRIINYLTLALGISFVTSVIAVLSAFRSKSKALQAVFGAGESPELSDYRMLVARKYEALIGKAKPDGNDEPDSDEDEPSEGPAGLPPPPPPDE